MAEKHIILEHKELINNGAIAVPESDYSLESYSDYNHAGSMEGLSRTDFQTHPYFKFDYLPIEFIQNPKDQIKKTQKVRNHLQALCNDGLSLDKSMLLSDEEFVTRILDYELVKGDIYLMRYSQPKTNEINSQARSVSYFVPKDILPEMIKSILSEHPESFKSGSAIFHKKILRPYLSRGRYTGRQHSNGPWIIYNPDKKATKTK